MAVERNEIVNAVTVEDKTGPGAASAVSNIEKIAGASDRMGDSVKQTSNAFAFFDKAAGSAATRLNQLRGAADPTYAAMQRLERAERDLDRAMRQGLTTDAEKMRILDQLSVKYGATAAANQNMIGAQRAATAGTKQFGLAAQNSSFQVADFFTQVASGQSPVRALSQQLPQLLGGFGVFGAVAGAAVAAAGALAVAFWDTEGAAADTELAIDSLDAELKTLGESADDARLKLYGLERGLEDMAEVRAVAALNAEIEQLTELQAKLNAIPAGRAYEDERGRAQVDVTLQKRALNAAQQTLDSYRETRDELKRLEDAKKAADEAAKTRAREDQQRVERYAETVDKIQTQISYETKLAEAIAQGEDAVRQVNVAREAHNEIQRLGIDALSAEGQAITAMVVQLDDLREAREAAEASRKGQDFLDGMERENDLLRLRLVHGEDELQVLEKQADLRDTLGRDLLPAEAASVRRLAEEHRRLTGEIEGSAEAEKKLLKTLESADDMPDEVAEEFIHIIEEIIR